MREIKMYGENEESMLVGHLKEITQRYEEMKEEGWEELYGDETIPPANRRHVYGIIKTKDKKIGYAGPKRIAQLVREGKIGEDY